MTIQATTAAEMMTRNLVTLRPTMRVSEAIKVLLKKRISGAPVVDKGQFIGVFSERSCMRVIVSTAYDQLPDGSIVPFVDTDPPTIGPETDLLTITLTFVDQGVRRLPVLENGCLLGQISRRDVMRKIVELSTYNQPIHVEPLYLSALTG